MAFGTMQVDLHRVQLTGDALKLLVQTIEQVINRGITDTKHEDPHTHQLFSIVVKNNKVVVKPI